MRELYDDQKIAMNLLRQTVAAGHKKIVLAAPTGSGKTVLASTIVLGARSKLNRVAFCVPALGLIDQTFERFLEAGIDPGEMGIMQADHPFTRPDAPIQIASAQTLARRAFPKADIVIVDEAHVQYEVYDRWKDVEGDDAPKLFIGLTATPWAKGMGKRGEALIQHTSVQELIDLGRLSPFRVFAPSHPDLSKVRTQAGDYREDDLGDVMSGPKLVSDVVETWLSKAEGRPTLCFAVNRAHAHALHAQFVKSGVSTEYVDAFTPREERDEIGRSLKDGSVKVVVNIGCLTTGIDWDVRCISMARPTKSEILFVQIIGRGLRVVDGKSDCIILDHSDNHSQLGFVTDIHHDELDDGLSTGKSKPKPQEEQLALPKECRECGCLMSPLVYTCPECGTVRMAPVRVNQVEGELVEFLSRAKRRKVETARLTDTLRDMGHQSIWSQLVWMQKNNGWGRGRASHMYRDIFGVWPKNLFDNFPVQPTYELQALIRQRNIAYAKSMAKANRQAAR